jgi:predicted ATPase/DNA-binding SARP family transcriptional activator
LGTLNIGLLGPPAIEVSSGALAVDTRKAVAILARLAVAGPQRRDALAAMLWPESDSSRSRGALRRTVSVLKQAVNENALEIGRAEIRLLPEAYTCDLDEFRELTARTASHHDHPADVCDECVSSLERAVSLHRGDFLEGFALRDSPEFDDWQFAQAEELRRELAGVLDRLVNALAHRGEFDVATEHARSRLTLDPLHEPTHRRLMLLHAWAGGREDAIRQYRSCVAVLDAELDVSPLEQTNDLYEAIVAGRIPPSPTGGQVVPDDVTPAGGEAVDLAPGGPSQAPLVGRSAEIAILIETYGGISADGALIVVEGEAGIGKTRLLEEFARTTGDATVTVRCYPGEETLAYAPIADALRTITVDRGEQSASKAWLREVSRLVPELHDRDPDIGTPPPLESPEATRRFFEGVRQTINSICLADRPALLVIEDLQWADSASLDAVIYLAHRLKGMALCLALSWRTEEIDRDHHLRRLLGELHQGDDAAAHLLLPRLTPDDIAELAHAFGVDDTASAQRLFAETEGLPLFAVEYLQAMGSGHLDDDVWGVPVSARDLVLQRLAGLSDTGRQVLTTAAVIGRSFDLDTLLHASGRSEEETVEALEELLASGFVNEIVERGHPRYDFQHQRMRDVVYEEASIARRRLLHGRAADAIGRRSRTGETPRPHAVVAQHLRLAGREIDAAREFVLAGEESRTLSAHADAVAHYRAALALDQSEAGELHEVIADLLTLLGDYPAALSAYEAAAAHSRSKVDVARCEHKIAQVHERRGDWEAVAAHVHSALATLPDGADEGLRARLEVESSLTSHRRGETEEARRRAERGLALAEGAGDALAAAQALNILGMIRRLNGDVPGAIDHLERSVEIARSTDDPTPAIAALNNLALAKADLGEHAAALEVAKTALAQCRQQGDRHREAAILNNLADLLRAAGQDDEAMEHLKQAVRIFAEIGEAEQHEPEIWKLVDW